MVISAGAWYDGVASTNGKYRVGHSAMLLVNGTTNRVHYFDFGRYHTPKGYGRVRDIETDADVEVINATIIRSGQFQAAYSLYAYILSIVVNLRPSLAKGDCEAMRLPYKCILCSA